MNTKMIPYYDTGNVIYISRSDLNKNKWNRPRDAKGRFTSLKQNCPYCGKGATEKGHDSCIADIPCVTNACCGHGRVLGYVSIKLPDGGHLAVYGFLSSIEYHDKNHQVIKALTILTGEDVENIESALNKLDLKKENDK